MTCIGFENSHILFPICICRRSSHTYIKKLEPHGSGEERRDSGEIMVVGVMVVVVVVTVVVAVMVSGMVVVMRVL